MCIFFLSIKLEIGCLPQPHFAKYEIQGSPSRFRSGLADLAVNSWVGLDGL
jgi:hypothetical protein